MVKALVAILSPFVYCLRKLRADVCEAPAEYLDERNRELIKGEVGFSYIRSSLLLTS